MVEQTLAGRAERLKAFDLAIAVLGRDKRFDPQNNPIVRIEVRRLRRDLGDYYLTDGRDDPIRITIPKGHYVPAFEVRGPEFGHRNQLRPSPRHECGSAGAGYRGGARVLAAGAGPCSCWVARRLGAGLHGVRANRCRQAGPAVVVVPFESQLTGGRGLGLWRVA